MTPLNMRVPLLLLPLLLAPAPFVAAAPEAADTPLFVSRDGRLCRMVHVTGLDGAPRRWTVTKDGREETLPADAVRAHHGGWLVPVEAPDRPVRVRIAAEPGGAVEHELGPGVRWRVFLTPHTHFDNGFTDTQPRVREQLARDLARVPALCRETDDWPEECRFRWTIEGTALFEDFEERRPDDVPGLVARLREGRVELAGAYCNLLTELCGDEELCRSLYPAARIRRQYGITIDTAIHDDVPGLTWQFAQILSRAGIRALSFEANRVRARFDWRRTDAPPRPFLWEAPDGSALPVWHTDRYREANFFRADCPETAVDDWAAAKEGNPYDELLELLHQQERRGTPVDAIQLRMGGDNLDPTANPCRWARAWNARWAWPRLVVATNRMFFDAVEPLRSTLERRRGDIPDGWADGAASAARETGMNRMSHERTGTAETLAALLGLPAARDTWGLYREMLLFDEHTWGPHFSLRTKDPENAATQWRIKAGYAAEADRRSRELLEAATRALTEAVRRPAGARLVVWNPAGRARSGIVRAVLPEGHAVFESGATESLPMQGSGSETAVLVRDIPPLGWRAFDVRPGRAAQAAPPPPAAPESCPVPALIRETGARRERVVPLEKIPAYDKKRVRTAPPPLSPDRVVEHGPVLTRWRLPIESPPGARAAAVEVVRDALDGVEVSVHHDTIETPEVEGVYLEFPLDLRRPAVRIGIPFGWMNPVQDRLPGSCADFFSMDRAVDLSDARGGVTLAALEAPLVEPGRITTDAWADAPIVDHATVYAYVMGNAWFTNYPISQGGPHVFHYAMRRYAGAFDPAAAARFAEEAARPPVARLVPPGAAGRWAALDAWSGVRVEPANVRVAAVKPAGDGRGLVIRLAECAGTPADARLALPGLGTGRLRRCSLLEDDGEPIGAADGSAPFRLGPWEIATVRFDGP